MDGSHEVCEEIKKAKLPMVIIGRDALTRADGETILSKTKAMANKLGFVNSETGWNGFNILHRSQGEINALELGLRLKPSTNKSKVIFLLGCDNYITADDIPSDAFVVYIVIFFVNFRVLMVIKELNMLISFYQLLIIWKDQELMLTLKEEYKWVMKSFHQLDNQDNNGKFSELFLKNVVLHYHTIVCKNLEQEFMKFHLIY